MTTGAPPIRAWVRKMRDRAWVDDVRLENAKLKPVRITGHLRVGHGTHKASGGLVRVTLVVASGQVIESLVSGDFYAIADAPTRIEEALLGDADGESIGRDRRRRLGCGATGGQGDRAGSGALTAPNIQ